MLLSAKYPFSATRTALSCLTALVFAVPLGLPLQAAPAQTVPSGLPSHFGFGLAAGQGDTWMPQSGIRWDYRYQYLVGGVNTGAGWETWNSSGTFASNYALESAQHGYIPVFPYYELLQSSGSCTNCNENQKDITNLNTVPLMSAYYQNFALLMKRLGTGTYDGVQGFGKTALIDLEPDFTGGYAMQAVNNNVGACFGFCTGQGNDPGLLKASVSSSGYADVAVYSNTYAGFTQALAHIRDMYAPNVLLAYHVSAWATGIDIGTDTSSNTNAAALGQQVGAFVSQFGAHELLFNDPLDRDAGQYKVQFGQNRWWDRNNVSFPNFARWEQYLQAAIVADANRPMLLWQVPLGNQYFDTENNTDGHFQDNRAEYIFGHVQELINVGIVGAMFGAGNAGNTTYTDSKNDGITNPASFCTSDGISSGQICNTHVSSVPDDDGGYVRLQGQAYYTNPIPLSGGPPPTSTPTSAPTTGPTSTPTTGPTSTPSPAVTPTATATQPGQSGFSSSAAASPNPIARGAIVSIASTVTNPPASPALIDVEVYDPSFTKVSQQYWDNQAFSAGQPRLFSTSWQVPSTAATGTYTIMVGVFGPGWGALENWNSSAGTFSVTADVASTATATTSPVNTSTPKPTSTPVPTNTPVATSTSTLMPTRTPTPTPGSTQIGFTTRAITPAVAQRGTNVALTARVRSNTAISALVDLEVYDASGTKVFQQAWDNRSFSAGQTRSLTATWQVSADANSGRYTVMIGVFSPGWGTLYSWNASAATVSVR
ncbi:MAG: hypothetical protein ACR2IK_09920 [Chloroflexota bacterium]